MEYGQYLLTLRPNQPNMKKDMENLRKANMQDPAAQKIMVYNDGELSFSNNIHELDFSSPYQLEEILVIIFVLEGKASININGTTYEAHPNDLLICPPNVIAGNGLVSLDFKSYSIALSTDYIRRIIPLADNFWDLRLLFEKNPVYSLQPEDARIFCQYYNLLYSKAQHPFFMQKKVIDALMLASYYDMMEGLNRIAQQHPRPFTASEVLFKRFIQLLGSCYPKPRTVAYYADRLNVTPKYLSTACRNAGGQRPSALIDQYVLKDIDYLMKHTQKSIKEIAFEVEFPNLSFFGKYVKKHWGMSPKAYREQAIQADAAAPKATESPA